MTNILDLCKPAVKDFALSVGAKIISVTQYVEKTGEVWMLEQDQAAAFYDGPTDTIVICDNRLSQIDLCVLHELGHWSGHSTRLNRIAVVATEQQALRDAFPKHLIARTVCTEEVTAQLTAFYLGLHLGIYHALDKMRLLGFYLNFFYAADVNQAETDAQCAAAYLISQTTQSRAA